MTKSLKLYFTINKLHQNTENIAFLQGISKLTEKQLQRSAFCSRFKGIAVKCYYKEFYLWCFSGYLEIFLEKLTGRTSLSN